MRVPLSAGRSATTRRDLSSVGNVAVMALIGLILATVVSFLLQSTAVYWIVTFLGVLIFVVLTTVDTQRIKRVMADVDGTGRGNPAVLGTLSPDFLNLFLFLLQRFGQAEVGNAQSQLATRIRALICGREPAARGE